MNVVPFPGALLTMILPPCDSMMCFTRLSPSPLPMNLRIEPHRDRGRTVQKYVGGRRLRMPNPKSSILDPDFLLEIGFFCTQSDLQLSFRPAVFDRVADHVLHTSYQGRNVRIDHRQSRIHFHGRSRKRFR
jgi:hypothetical protein